jgi:hypothetical protein
MGVLSEVWEARVSNGEEITVLELEGGERLCFRNSNGERMTMPSLLDEQTCRYAAELSKFSALNVP